MRSFRLQTADCAGLLGLLCHTGFLTADNYVTMQLYDFLFLDKHLLFTMHSLKQDNQQINCH